MTSRTHATNGASVGLVGGLGPESTIDYYRRILDAWKRHDPSSAPSIVIDSLDFQRGLYLVEHDRQGLTEYLAGSVRRLAGAGATFVAMTANTAHIVFDEVQATSPVPMISIVETCAAEARRLGLRRLLLLGTRFTMSGPFYPAVFSRAGIDLIAPNATDQAWVHERYLGELIPGVFKDETRKQFTDLIVRFRDRERIDGVIMGGTEIPLLLPGAEVAGLPSLDTTALHVTAIVDGLRANVAEPHEPG